MIRDLARALGLALIVVVAGATTSNAQTSIRVAVESPGSQIDISYFYDNLSSDGDWFRDPNRGWCWTPYDVTADWRPYYDGNWQYTDDGWSWVSNESFGWATYHYGRWFFDDAYGWAWVPGTEWAPAWVAWRANDDYVGWAPLPPEAVWNASIGLSFAHADAIPSNEWCFVPQRNVLDVNINLQVTSVSRNVTIFGESRDATRYAVRQGRPNNIGFDVTRVEARVGRPVPRATINDADAPDHGRGQDAGNGAVSYYRPNVQRSPSPRAPSAAVTGRGNAIADADLQRTRQAQQARLDSDLNAEHQRLLSDQDKELRAQAPGPRADAVRKQQAVEQQAFAAHSAQQRQVFTQRMQKRVVRPGLAANAAQPGSPGNAKGNGQGNAQGKGNGNGNGNGPDKGGK